MSILFFTVAISFILLIVLALTKGRRLLDKFQQFDFWLGITSAQKVDFGFIVMSAITANTIFAALALLFSSIWKWIILGTTLSANVLVAFVFILTLGIISARWSIRLLKMRK